MRNLLLAALLSLIPVAAMAQPAIPSSSSTWLLDPSINAAGPDTCAMVMYNMGLLGAVSIEPIPSPSTNYRLTAYTLGRVGAGSSQLQGVADLPIVAGSTFDSAQDFSWQLFLRLNELDLGTARPLSSGNWTDCVAANELVIGDAYP